MERYSSAQSTQPLLFEPPFAGSQLLSASQVPQTGLLIEEREVSAATAQEGFSAISKVAQQPSDSSKGWCWKVFGSTFITIFLAELGDKTQVATLLMSAEFHSPWVVFMGAAAALISTSLLGVLVGRWLSTRISARTLDTATGITLAFIAIWLLWDAVKL